MRGCREWSRQCRFNDLNCGGSPLRHEEEHEGLIVLDLCIKLVEMIFWTPVSMASYWLQVVTRPPRLPEDSAWLFPHGSATQSVGFVAYFAWQFLLAASYFGVPVIILTMCFWVEPNYFPRLRQLGTYVLKDCRCLT